MTHGHYHIGIDCRLSGSTHAGIGRYIENLITRLPFDKEHFRWVLFFYDQSQVPTTTAFTKAISQQKVTIVFAPFKHYSLAEQLKLPSVLTQHQLDLLHVPHFNVPLFLPNSLPIVVTIHDLLWHEQRGTAVTTLAPWKYWLKYLGYRLVTHLAVTRAKAILVPSQAVKKTVVRYFPQVEKQVAVTYEGATGETFATSTKKHSQAIDSKTLLYVGSLYPHKNITVVLQALKQLPDFKLEIVGSRSVFRDAVAAEAARLGVTNQVNFLGFVPDSELSQKYQTCFALIQPSLSEGFGLTGLEAMTAGGVVIASDIPIFKEIYQDGALYFDPHSSDSFIATVNQLTPKQRPPLLSQAKRVAAQYSWDTMANQTVAAYQKILADEKIT